MSRDFISRWYEPRTILALVGLREDSSLLLHAVAEARRSGARLLLVHVVPAIFQMQADASDKTLLLPSTRSLADALDETALRLQWQGVLCEPMVLRSSSPEDLRSLVRSRNVDRVFLASPLDHPAGQLIQADLIEHLMATLEVPLCIIGRRVHGETGDRHRLPGRILLAHSPSSGGKLLLDLACGLAQRRQASLTVLHVVQTAHMTEQQRVQAHDLARIRLSSLVAGRTRLPRWPEIVIRDGEAAAEIIKEGICPWSDLIVLGSPSLSAGDSHWWKEVLHPVIHESRCPILVLGPAAAAKGTVEVSSPELKTGSLHR
jgi:nucleotide-binding universal stress UspA family protein